MTGNALVAQKLAVSIAWQCFYSHRYATKVEVERAVKATAWDKDAVSLRQRVEQVFAEAERIRLLKCERFHRLPDPPGPGRHERLDALKRQRFGQVLRTARFRTTESGNHYTQLTWVESPDQVRAEGVMSLGRKYPHAWARTKDSLHRFYVPRLWYTQTVREGIAVLGARLTLAATLRHAIPGCDVENVVIEDGVVDQVRVYQTVWCEQGRGFSLKTQREALAVLWARVGFQTVKLAWFHAADTDPERAMNRAYAGVLRRARQGPQPRQRERRPHFEREEQLYGDYTATLEEVVHLGFCEKGVREWACKVGIDPDAGVTTVRQVIDGFRLHPEVDPIV